MNTWFKKEKKKRKEKKNQPRDRPSTISSPPLAIEISPPREIIVTFPHPPLFSHDGYCLRVDVKPPSLRFWGQSASHPWGSCSRSPLTCPCCSVPPITPHLLCPSLSILHGRKASRFVQGRHYRVGLSVEVGLGLLGSYLWWGKPRLVTSPSRLSSVVIPKALAMAGLSVVASLLAILPSPSSRFCPLAQLVLQQLVP